MALLLVLGLVVIGGIMSAMSGATGLFSAIMSMPDAGTIADLERKARAAGR